MSAAIAAQDLSGGYPEAPDAISGLDFAVPAGRLVAVLGANGGGKTTLFRALLGELPVMSGKLELAGRPAYVPQTEHARLDLPVTAFDVALMGSYGRLAWWKRAGQAERGLARAALERVGLADSSSNRFGRLSGGQRQRVLIARALVQDSPVMLLDEPFAGVDIPSEERIEALLGELRSEGRSLLVATHDVEQARRADLVLCVRRTQIAFGPPAEVLTPEALAQTYGGELVLLGDGMPAVTTGHHHHDH